MVLHRIQNTIPRFKVKICTRELSFYKNKGK